jgi:hypothetical protein
VLMRHSLMRWENSLFSQENSRMRRLSGGAGRRVAGDCSDHHPSGLDARCLHPPLARAESTRALCKPKTFPRSKSPRRREKGKRRWDDGTRADLGVSFLALSIARHWPSWVGLLA